jgi:hypothetical protein
MEVYLFNKGVEYCEKCLALLYQLRAYNLKITLLVKGFKVTKWACMAKERTPVEACMVTLDKVDFCPPTYPKRYIFYKKARSV